MNRLRRPASRRSFYIGLAICLGIVGFFLVLEHRAHVIPYVPYLLLALCPLLHMFMHRGHGGHDHKANGHDRSDHGAGSGSR
jgi:hypothetical protein